MGEHLVNIDIMYILNEILFWYIISSIFVAVTIGVMLIIHLNRGVVKEKLEGAGLAIPVAVIVSPISVFIICYEIFLGIKRFNFREWKLQRKWYRKWRKGEYYYVMLIGWVNEAPTNMIFVKKYEVHTKNKSYYYDFNWPEQDVDDYWIPVQQND